MDKLILAHSYMVEYVKSNGLEVTDLEVRCAFDIAEAMLAENEKRTDKTRPAVLDEFQVDWSQAPHDAMQWRMFGDGSCIYYDINGCVLGDAPSFNYQGNWKDSLMERK